MVLPKTRYASNGDVRIAYQVIGQGPIDLVFVPGYVSNLEVQWEDPGFSHLMTRLGAFARLIMLDKRGTGLSDRVDIDRLPSLETRMADVRAVMDAVGSERAVLLGVSEGGPMAILFAATYPKRTRALVLYGAYAHFHTWVMPREALDDFIRGIESGWGTGASVTRFAPDQGRDERFHDWWGRYERLAASPTAAVALARMNAAIDVRSVLPAIRVPTVVIHRTDDARIKIGGGRYLAEKIRGARFVELPGRDHPIWTGDVDRVVDEIEEFVTGVRPAPEHARVLATLLLVAPRAPARPPPGSATGSGTNGCGLCARRRCISSSAMPAIRSPLASKRSAARFDGPARAVRCAIALGEAAGRLDIKLAAGVHAGEVEIHHDSVFGPRAACDRCASRRAPRLARCWCRAWSPTSSQGPDCTLPSADTKPSMALPANCACSRSRPRSTSSRPRARMLPPAWRR